MNLFHNDVEMGHPLEKDFAFNNNVANAEVSIRLGFLRKVYGILFTQLAITAMCAGVMFAFKEPLLVYMEHGSFLPFFVLIVALGLLVALMFKKNEAPLNYILLFSFTIAESIAVGFVVVNYSASVVVQALGLTALATFGLMSYAMQSKRDFSQWGAGLCIALLVLVVAGPINLLLGSSLFELSFAVGGAVLFSMLIIYDTHRIMHHCSPEDYIVACIDLYLDILNLFIHLLRVLRAMQHE